MSDPSRLTANYDTNEHVTAQQPKAARDDLHNANRLATIGELAAGIVHDLATPLSVISGHAGMIARGELRGDDAQESARIIVEQSDRISKLVKELLQLARRKPGLKEPMSLIELVMEAVTYAEPVARKLDVEILVDPPSSDLVVPLDAVAVQQVVINLIINGAQAMRDRGGVLRISFAEESDMAVVHVDDQGEGIPPENLDKIFKPFFTTKADSGGAGIGLAVSSQIVQGHGGAITVESTPGEGSRFSIHLPLESESQ
jgi:two-component system, NtrC family, sensor kinase